MQGDQEVSGGRGFERRGLTANVASRRPRTADASCAVDDAVCASDNETSPLEVRRKTERAVQRPPRTTPIRGPVHAALACREKELAVRPRRGERHDRLRHVTATPVGPAIRAHEKDRLACVPVRAKAIHAAADRLESVEVHFPLQRNSPPGLAGVVRSDQTEERRQAIAAIGMARSKEAVRAHDREAHRVLVAISHASSRPRAGRLPEEASVCRDEESAVARIDTEPVDVNRPRIACLRQRCAGRFVLTASGGRDDANRHGNCGDCGTCSEHRRRRC